MKGFPIACFLILLGSCYSLPALGEIERYKLSHSSSVQTKRSGRASDSDIESPANITPDEESDWTNYPEGSDEIMMMDAAALTLDRSIRNANWADYESDSDEAILFPSEKQKLKKQTLKSEKEEHLPSDNEPNNSELSVLE
jgi:hypothetical protein